MKIKSEKLNLEEVDGITYWITHDDPERPKGKAQIIFKKVNRDEFSDHNYELLKQIGFENKTICYFESLYPYGYPHKEEYVSGKRGLGKLVLDEIIKDSKENEIDIICGFNSEIPGFLAKNGFKPLCKKNNSYYLVISS